MIARIPWRATVDTVLVMPLGAATIPTGQAAWGLRGRATDEDIHHCAITFPQRERLIPLRTASITPHLDKETSRPGNDRAERKNDRGNHHAFSGRG
jgi:hypothetical protein